MAITANASGGSVDNASAYTVTESLGCAVGDFVICIATGFEFSSGSAGTRALTMVTSGWLPLYSSQEFQIYPSSPPNVNRRILIEAWYKVATSTMETANVTMNGATGGFLTLAVKLVRVQGLPPPLLGQGPVTRRENVDLGVNPALTYTHAPLAVGGTRVGLLLQLATFGTQTTPTGYTLLSMSSGTTDLVGGNVGLRLSTVTGTAPTPLTFPNGNGQGLITSLTFGDAPVLTHTGAMTT